MPFDFLKPFQDFVAWMQSGDPATAWVAGICACILIVWLIRLSGRIVRFVLKIALLIVVVMLIVSWYTGQGFPFRPLG